MIRETQGIGIGVVGILLVVVAGVLLRDLASGLPVGPDAAWQALMSSHRWAPAVSLARVMAWIGAGPGVWFVTAALVIVELLLRRWRAAVALLLAVDLSSSLSSTIKLLSVRPRPTGALDVLSSFSFPSGHTTWAAAATASLALALPRVWTWVLAGSWIAFMAWSRTYLGVHWLSDVAAGAVLGVSAALLAAGLVALLAPGDPHAPPPPAEPPSSPPTATVAE
jgi:membrane-associated phospholipid phosphatase